MRALNEFRTVIYNLCRNNGFRAQLYRTTQAIDITTGRVVDTRLMYPLRHAVFLPNQMYRDFSFGLLMKMSAAIQFGGILDMEQRRLVIDRKELPRGFLIDTSTDYIVFNHNRYEISKVTEMEEIYYYLIDVKRIIGSVPFETYVINYRDYLEIDHSYNSGTLFKPESDIQHLSDFVS